MQEMNNTNEFCKSKEVLVSTLFAETKSFRLKETDVFRIASVLSIVSFWVTIIRNLASTPVNKGRVYVCFRSFIYSHLSL